MPFTSSLGISDSGLNNMTLGAGTGAPAPVIPTATPHARVGLGHVGLGSLVHEITSPYGTDFPPALGNMWLIDSAPGGYGSAYGEVEEARVVGNPLVYTFGAIWRVWHAESGAVVFAGRLTAPSFSGGVAQLNARGWGQIPDRSAGRLLYQSRYYADFAPAEGDPYRYSDDNQAIQASTNGGQLRFVVDKASEADGDKGRLAFWAPGNIITRVAGTLTGSGTDNRLVIDTAVGPSGTITQRRGPQTVNLANGAFDVGNAGGDPGTTTWSGALNTTDDMVIIGVRAVTPTGSGTLRIHVENLRINGIAVGDGWVTSDIVSDVASRMGMSTIGVLSAPDLALPWDQKTGTYADVLHAMSLLSDWVWRTRDDGAGPVMEFAPWCSTVWTLVDPEMDRTFLPLEQYNQVVVPFVYSNGATGLATADASPDPFAAFGITNTYADLVSAVPAIDSATAQSLAADAVAYLSTLRYGGTVTVSEVLDASGGRQTAHAIRAGDGLYVPEFATTLRISEVRHTASAVTLTFDERLATVDKMIASAQQRVLLGGQVGQ